ncbi:MAG: hypothetical protein J6D21_01585 [Clostridia bacterium]|nr:hypothetical protein [Clostridia bacterium]
MKIIAVILVIMVVVAAITGFNFAMYKVSDLSVYPELDFATTVDEFSSASKDGINSTFTLLKGVSDSLLFLLEVMNSEYDMPEGWSDEEKYYYTELKKIEDQLNFLDRWRLDGALRHRLSAPDYLSRMYFKYFGEE